jgi:hypothetical protein
MVKDVTDDLFYGEDTNFNGQLDYNERDGDETPPNDDGDDELDLGWISYLTCYTPAEGTNAKVNLNTAPEAVLTALLGGDEDATVTALEIISFRETAEGGIEQPSDLTDNGVMSSSDFSGIEEYVSVTSDVFTVYCVAAADRNGTLGTRTQAEFVVNRASRPYELLFSYQGASY